MRDSLLFVSSVFAAVGFTSFASAASLAPVPVTFAVVKKEPHGTVYPRVNGKEDRTQPITDQVTYTVQGKSGAYQEVTMFGRKGDSYGIGNSGLLSWFNEEGRLDGTVSGWAIMAQPEYDGEEGSLTYDIYFYKSKTAQKVSWFSVKAFGEMTGNFTLVVSKSSSSEVTSMTCSGSVGYESPVAVDWYDGDHMLGLLTCTVTPKIYFANPSDKSSGKVIGVPGAGKISNIVGYDSEGSPFSGSISFGASKIQN